MQVVKICLLVFFLAGCSVHYRADTYNPDSKWTAKKQMEDLNYFKQIIQNVHPEPYFFCTKDSIATVESSLFNSVAKDRIDFYLRFRKLMSVYNNGHLDSFLPYEEFNKEAEKGNLKVFPYSVRFERNQLFAKIDSEYVRLLSINSMRSDSLLNAWRKYFGGLSNYRDRNLAKEFGFLMWASNIKPPFVLETSSDKIVSPGKQAKPLRSPSEILSKTGAGGIPVADQLFEFKMIDTNIAYINYKAMFLEKETAEFLEKTFQIISDQHAAGLIVDLRENGGGQSRFGRMLLAYITDKSYKMSGGKQWKVSGEFKSSFKKFLPWALRWIPIQMFNAGFKKYWKAKEGTFLTDTSDLIYPENNALRYKGEVVFLTGAGTFSSAMMLANAVKDYGLAKILGQPTGEAPNDFGEIAYFQLPNSKITFSVPSAKFIRANGDINDRNAVIPDLLVPDEDKNAAIKKAIRLIKNKTK